MKNVLVRLIWRVTQGLVLSARFLLFRRISEKKIRRILVFRTGQLGDTVVALPAMNHIRAVFPQAHIAMLTDYHRNTNYVLAREVVSLTGSVDEFLLYQPSEIYNGPYRKQLARRIKEGKYDILFYLGVEREPTFRLLRNALWWRFEARVRHANGFVKGQLIGKLEERFIQCYPPLKETDRLLRAIRSGSVTLPENSLPKFGLKASATELTERLLELMKGYVVCAVAPGSKMPVKRWGTGKFKELGWRLLEHYPDLFLLVLGGQEDTALGDELVACWGQRCANVAGKASIGESYLLLSNCQLFVGNDTGVMHLAAAAGIPCVAIFTARAPENVWSPYGNHHRVIRHETECHYCMLKDCTAEKARCIQSIQVDEVFQAAVKTLGDVYRKHRARRLLRAE